MNDERTGVVRITVNDDGTTSPAAPEVDTDGPGVEWDYDGALEVEFREDDSPFKNGKKFKFTKEQKKASGGVKKEFPAGTYKYWIKVGGNAWVDPNIIVRQA